MGLLKVIASTVSLDLWALVMFLVLRGDYSKTKTELCVRILCILVSTQYEKPVITISF